MRIDGITLHNYRLFEHLKLEFPERFTVLIGENGRGKSTILDGLAVAIGAFLLGFDNLGQINTIEKDDVKRSSKGLQSMELQLPSYVEAWSSSFGDITPRTWKREVSKISTKTTASFKAAKWLMAVAELYQGAVRKGNGVILPVFAYHGTGRLWAEHSHKTKYAKNGSRIEQGYHLCLSPKSSPYDFLSWFRTYEDEVYRLGRSEHAPLLSAFTTAIISLIPSWKDIAFSAADDDLVGVMDVMGQEKQFMPFKMLSDGYRNMIGMAADIAYRCIKLNPHLGAEAVTKATGIVLIDEIDLHLHPKWQKKVVDDLKRVFPGIQFIATTHSPFIIQSLKNAEVIDLNGQEMETDYLVKSIEDIAEGEMGVENARRSEKFIAWQAAAEEYYSLLELNGSGDQKVLAERKASLDELEILFNENPAWVALLKAERKSKELRP